MAVRIAGTVARNSFLSRSYSYLAFRDFVVDVALPVLQIPLEASKSIRRERGVRDPFRPCPERIKNDHAVGFSAGDVMPSSWMHG
jgi:hypothetical protein